MLKRYVSLAAALLLISTAAACGDADSSSSGNSAAAITATEETQTVTASEKTSETEVSTDAASEAPETSAEAAFVENAGTSEYSMNINDERTFSFSVDNALWVYAPHEVVHDGTEILFFRTESGFPGLYVEVKNLGEGGYEEFADAKRSTLAPVECSKAEYPAGETGVVKSHGGEGTVFTEYFIPADGRYIVFGFASYEDEYRTDVPEFEKIINTVEIY